MISSNPEAPAPGLRQPSRHRGDEAKKVLILGATGYIGGRLVPRLLKLGHRLRVIVRDPERAASRPWGDQVEILRGDLLDPKSLEGAFEGIDTAYYLVHSMYAGKDFARKDRLSAENFCAAARGLAHVIYLGGPLPKKVAPDRPRGSEHLRSRAEIGRILHRNLPTTEFRAGPIIGSGSASFEMIRYLTERLPVMLAPHWVRNEVQPIAVRDVLSYLCLALDRGPVGVVEIGSESMSYRQMIQQYARLRRLRRLILLIPPWIPQRVGWRGLGLITPLPDSLTKVLVQGMELPLHIRTFRSKRYFPEIVPISYRRAVQLALLRIEEHAVTTRWSDTPPGGVAYEYADQEGMVREVRTRHVTASPEEIFAVLSGLGGQRGWLRWNWAWSLRGLIDQILGGPGLARGRRNPNELITGEALDFWRVEALKSPSLLRLRAEAKLPGHAWLQWDLRPDRGGTLLTQSALFTPRGLFGTLYWYGLYPFHRLIFKRLIVGIADLASTGGWRDRETGDAEVVDVGPKQPPKPSRTLLNDLRTFMFRRSCAPTKIDFSSQNARQDYSYRIVQRLDLDVTGYSVLNLHHVGVEAPTKYVFEELLDWDRNSSCWPNQIATVERLEGELDHLRIDLFGKSWLATNVARRLGLPPLFELHLLRKQSVSRDLDGDNARYLLYECKGGYPVGILVFYVRSSIGERGEREATQVFIGVGFDFYGQESWPLFHPVNRIWEFVHNRVTSNVLCRFKQLCEWRFERMQEGD